MFYFSFISISSLWLKDQISDSYGGQPCDLKYLYCKYKSVLSFEVEYALSLIICLTYNQQMILVLHLN